MKTEEYIDNYIEQQLKIEPNPYLTTRIMSKLDSINEKNAFNFSPIQKIGITASIAASIMIGIMLGTNYKSDTSNSMSININDSKIENFQIFDETDELPDLNNK
jgi:hypothetical protein